VNEKKEQKKEDKKKRDKKDIKENTNSVRADRKRKHSPSVLFTI
jgi:hypothetical protein